MSDWFRTRGLSAAKVIGDQLKTIKDDIVGPVDALKDGSPMSLFVCDLQKKVELLENKCRILEGDFDHSKCVDSDYLADLGGVQRDLNDSLLALSDCIDRIDRDFKRFKTKQTDASNNTDNFLKLISEMDRKHDDELERLRMAKDDLRNREIERMREQFATRIAQLDRELNERDERIKNLEKTIVDGASESNKKYQSSEKALIDMYAIFDEFQRDKEKTFRRIANERELDRNEFNDSLNALNERLSEKEAEIVDLKANLQTSDSEIRRLNEAWVNEINECDKLRLENDALHATVQNLSPITSPRMEKFLIKKMLISFWKADERLRYQALRPILGLLEFDEDEVKSVLHGGGESIGQMFVQYIEDKSKMDDNVQT